MAQQTTPGTTCVAAWSAAGTPPSTDSDKNFHTLDSSAEPKNDTYWAERWSLGRHLPLIHDAALFVVRIGGRM